MRASCFFLRCRLWFEDTREQLAAKPQSGSREQLGLAAPSSIEVDTHVAKYGDSRAERLQ